jgi:monofunctional biosynthetic peptidoglycan transglycosylase
MHNRFLHDLHKSSVPTPITTPEATPPAGPFRGALNWVRSHKVKTLLFLAVTFLVIELLTIPFFAISGLNSENPKQTALMRQRIREADSEGKPLRIMQRWIPLSRVPQHVLNAVIVAEDGTFYEHGGIDWFEVQESIEKNIEEGRAARGASTISQQLAKNLFLSTSKDPVRKLKEVIITLLMEGQLSKRRILELYVNCIEWGRGVFGVEAAARTYFGKSASALTLDEGARLAAVIPSPLRHRPDTNSRYVLRRKGIVLNRMFARGQIPDTTEEEDQSKSLEQSPEGESPVAPLQEEAPAAPDTSATDEGR